MNDNSESELEVIFYGKKTFDIWPAAFAVTLLSLTIAIPTCKIIAVYTRFRIPLQCPCFVFTIICALLFQNLEYLSYFMRFDSYYYGAGPLLMGFYFPLFAVRTAFSIDRRKILKILPQMWLISLSALLIGVMHGFIMKVVKNSLKADTLDALLQGFVFCTTQPHFISQIFRGMEKYKYFHYLLEGESVLTNTWILTWFQVLQLIYKFYDHSLSEVAFVVFLMIFGGFILGCICGKLATFPLTYMNIDLKGSTGIIISMTIITYYVANFICLSPFIAVTTMVFVILIDRNRFSKINNEHFHIIFDNLFILSDVIVYNICVLQISLVITTNIFSIIHLMFFNFISILICRFVVLTIMYPILRKIGFGFSYNTILILSWSSIMSTTTLIMTLMLINDTFTHRVTNSLMPYVLFNLLGSVAVNGPGIAVYIKVICSQSISQSKIANMDTIIKHITSTRDRYIYLMKMDRYMADVNWTYVREMTTIIQPYDTNDIEVSNKNKLTTSTKCPFCSKIISLTLSNKKMMDLKRETKKQIWNYMKTIVVRQHEIGMVSRESLQMILKKFDHLLNDDNFETVDIAKLKDFFAKNKYLDFIQRIYNKFFSFQRANVLMPRKRYRRICYKIIMNKMFTILIYTINVAVTIPLILNYFRDHYNFQREKVYYYLFLAYHVAVLIYIVEFVLTIMAYSWVYLFKDGVRTYLRSLWHILDFITMILCITEIILIWEYYNKPTPSKYVIIRSIRYQRLVRVLRLFSNQFPKILIALEGRLEIKFLCGYEIARALKESIDEMIMVMNRVIDSSDTREYYLRKFVQDRDDLGQLMMKIQISYPWIPVTIKTKQMITSCRFVMTEGLLNLKASGFVDDIEYSQLMQSIKSKETLIKSVKRVKLPLAKIIFLSVPWMRMDDANTAEYLFIRSSVRVFESGYEFCKVGDYLDGILILLTGVLNIIYEPTEEILKKNKEYGYIPVVECLRSTILEDSSNFHILPGNTIGEINLLTGRPYDCRIVAVSNVKAYFINIKYIMEAIKQNSNLAYGLESSMWKHAVMRIAEKLLKNTPVYEFNTLREIQTKLERSIMPDFNAYEHFLVTDIIEDVILIDGIIIDSYSRTSYCAPYYIPRSVVKINLPKNEHSKQVAKLLIIPIPDVDYLTMINAEPRVVELVPSGDSRCTYGPKVKKKRKKKGKKGKKELLQSYSSVVSKSIGSIASFHHSSHSLSIGSSKDKSIT